MSFDQAPIPPEPPSAKAKVDWDDLSAEERIRRAMSPVEPFRSGNAAANRVLSPVNDDRRGNARSTDRIAAEEPPRRTLPLMFFEEIKPVGSTLNLVRGLLGETATSMVVGASGAGKSFFALDIAFAVARGVPWRGMSTKQGAALYIAAEGAHGMRQRFEAWRQDSGITDDVPIAMIPASVDLISTGDDADAIIEAASVVVERYQLPVVLIVIDTLHRSYGGADENDAAAAGAFIRMVDRIREATGAHIMILHHLGKDETRGARGSSALKAAVDTEITLTKPEHSEAITAHVTKQKDGPDGGIYSFRLQDVSIGVDEDGTAITCPVVKHLDIAEVPKTAAKLTDRQILAMRALHNHFAGDDAPSSIDFDAFTNLMKLKGVLDADTARQRFTDLRQQLEKKRLIYFRDGQIGLTAGSSRVA